MNLKTFNEASKPQKQHEKSSNKTLQVKQLIELIESQDLAPWARGDDKESDRELIGERYEA